MRLLNLIVFLVCTLQLVTRSLSQEALRPIFQGEEISNLYWSVDSLKLTFQSGYATLDQPETPLMLYDSVMTNVNSLETGVATDPLLRSIVQNLAPNLTRTNMFLSPNSRYGVAADADNEWNTVIVDTLENRLMNTGVRSTGISNPPEEFLVLWSEDSQTLVFATSATLLPEPIFFHWVTGYADFDSTIHVQELGEFKCGQGSCNPIRVHDLSSDGQKVLIQVARDSTYPLAIWDATGTHQIVDSNVKVDVSYRLSAASFAPNNEDNILIVDMRGLVSHSLETGETTILRPDITLERFRYAKFSPNGELLALADNTPGRPAAVYLFDVAAALQTQESP